MNVRPIKTESDYDYALARIETLWEAKQNTPNGDELKVLVTLVEAYESEKYPIYPPDPIEAIKFRMKQMNLRKMDLEKYLGSKSRVTEVLQRKRKLSLNMIKSLYKEFGIPAESLLA